MRRNTSGVRRVVRDGKVRLLLDITYVDPTGRKRRFRRDAALQTSAGARSEAERLRANIAKYGMPELKAEAPLPLFRSFVEGSFEHLSMPTFRPSTRRRYRDLFRQSVLAAFGDLRLDEVDGPVFVGFAAKLAERGVQAKGAVNLARTVLKAAVALEVLARMPEVPKGLVRHGKKLPSAPSEQEVVDLLTNATGWLRVAIAIASYAGLRLGEVRGLEVRDVDVSKGVIHVRRALSEDEIVAPKSGNDRVVPLCNELRSILDDAMKLKLPKARVIVNEAGKTPTRQNVLSRLKLLQTKHGLPARSFHALRHFFCSVLVRRGASLEAVKLLAGHSSLSITSRYVHADGGDLRAAIDKLN